MSQLESYDFAEISYAASLFEFTSSGPKGDIKKIVQFEETASKYIWFLSFGNINEDGTLDDTTINDNKDRDKILYTVAKIVFDFTEKYPDRYIFFTGSSLGRIRLYRMVITLKFEELTKMFMIWGIDKNGKPGQFEKNQEYYAFFVKRK